MGALEKHSLYILLIRLKQRFCLYPRRPQAYDQSRGSYRTPRRCVYTADAFADKLNYKPGKVSNLVFATVRGADAHATLLVHGVQAAVGVAVVVLGVPDGKGVPAGHGVLCILNIKSATDMFAPRASCAHEIYWQPCQYIVST